MGELTQEVLQDFSDQVAEVCEKMGLDSDQMLQAIGSTFIGAVLSFGKAEFEVDVTDVATATVRSKSPWERDAEFSSMLDQSALHVVLGETMSQTYARYLEERADFSSVEEYIGHQKQKMIDRGEETLASLLKGLK